MEECPLLFQLGQSLHLCFGWKIKQPESKTHAITNKINRFNITQRYDIPVTIHFSVYCLFSQRMFSFINNIFFNFGSYYYLIIRAFSRPEKGKVFRQRIFEEIDLLGIGSIPIVLIISLFMGAVITIQAAFGFESPWFPLFAV